MAVRRECLADTNNLEIMLFAITLVIDFSIDIEISILTSIALTQVCTVAKLSYSFATSLIMEHCSLHLLHVSPRIKEECVS